MKWTSSEFGRKNLITRPIFGSFLRLKIKLHLGKIAIFRSTSACRSISIDDLLAVWTSSAQIGGHTLTTALVVQKTAILDTCSLSNTFVWQSRWFSFFLAILILVFDLFFSYLPRPAPSLAQVLFNEYKRAVAVQFDRFKLSYLVCARREIILSGGSINTPQLLMLSGVGPAHHLSSMGVSDESEK